MKNKRGTNFFLHVFAALLCILCGTKNANAIGGITCAAALASPALAGNFYGGLSTCGLGNNVITSNGQDYIIAFCPTINGCFELTTPASSPGDVIIQTKFVVRAYDSCNFSSSSLLVADSLVIAANTVVAGPTISFNAQAGKCYYFVFDVNDQGSLWGDCINFSAQFQLLSNTGTQVPGAATCTGSLLQPAAFNTAYNGQSVCCVGNSYPATAGNDWYYSVCPTIDCCVEFLFDSIICTDAVPSGQTIIQLFDTCWLGAIPLQTRLVNTGNSAASAMLSYTLKAGKCYYILMSSPLAIGKGGCFNYNMFLAQSPALSQVPGANSCSNAQSAVSIVPGTYYSNQINCCSGASPTASFDEWHYNYCATFDGCAYFMMDSVSQHQKDTLEFNVFVINGCGDTIREAFRGGLLFNNLIPHFMYFDVEAGQCYTFLVHTDSVYCLTYDLQFMVNPTAPPNNIGSNDTLTHCNTPLQADSLYKNQSTCCLGDNFNGDFVKDWYYCISPDINGCIQVEIDSIESGTPGLTFKEYIMVRDTAQLNVQDATDGLIIMDVDSNQNYTFIIDGVLEDFESTASCMTYQVKWSYVDSTINTQTPGGNLVDTAALPANQLQSNVWYNNQTTCCAKNDYLYSGGMDWVYRFCTPQKGCFGVVLRNWWSSDSAKASDYSIWINEDATNGVAREYEGQLQASTVMEDTLFFTGDSGVCFNIFMDAATGNRSRTGCYNYDIMIIDQYPQQLPGGINNVQASATCVTQGDTIVRHNTCCTGYNNGQVGQDWRYCFIPPATAIYTAVIYNLENRDDKNFFQGRLSHYIANNVTPNVSSLSQSMPPLAKDQIGTSVSFCADSGVVQYLHVDDNRANAQNACMDYDFLILNAAPLVPPASNLGGPNLPAACAVPLPLIDTTIADFSSCCFPSVRFYRFCASKDMCIKYQLTNYASTGTGAGSATASTWYAVGPNNPCNINGGLLGSGVDGTPITFHVDSGKCYILRINNLLGACAFFDMNIQTASDTTQNPGGYSCATAALYPIALGTVVSGHTNCKAKCILTSNHGGSNLVCTAPSTLGSDFTYLLKPNQIGEVTVRLDSLKTINVGASFQVVVSVYKACNGSSYTNNVANSSKVINNIFYDSLEVSFVSQSITDSFYIVLDVYSSSVEACYMYRLSSRIITPALGCTNAGFEQGNTAQWQLSIGNSTAGCTNCVCPAPQYSPCPTYVGNSPRHTLVTSGTDFYGGFPKVHSGTYSILLGNTTAGAEAEGMVQYYYVDSFNTSYTYNYAVVFQDPGHAPNNQPFFRAKIKSADGSIIPCTEFCVSAQSTVPGFLVSANSGSIPVYYKPWSTVTVDLTAFIGQLVRIEFESGDCSDGGHFGYAYIDCNCTTIDFNDNDTLCATNCDTLYAPSGYASYSWQPGGDTTEFKIICLNSDTTVTLTYETFNGCTLQKTYNLYVQPQFSISAKTTCANANTLSAISSLPDSTFTYTWLTIPPQAGNTIDSVIVGNIYTVQVSDGVCYTATYVLTAQPAYPVLIVDTQTAALCNGAANGTITIAATAGVQPYNYVVNGVAGSTLTGLAAGSYFATVSDSNLCADTIQFTIVQPPILTASITLGTPCLIGNQNTAATASGMGGTPPYTFGWSNGTLGQTTLLAAGIHTLTITDAKGCSASSTINLVNGLNVNTALLSPSLCLGDSVAAIYASAGSLTGISYTWNTIPQAVGDTLSNIPAGTYIVTATDGGNCTGTASITIAAGSTFTLNTTTTGSCTGYSTGTATANVTGGNSGYTFTWQPGSAAGSIQNNLLAGAYTVTATSALGCSKSAIATVLSLPNPIVVVTPSGGAYCTNTGLSIAANGANTYSYYQNSFSSPFTPPFILASTTTVIVVGSNTAGCTDTANVVYATNPTYNDSIAASICKGDNYNGFTTSGIYNTVYQSIANCDSVISLTLTVNDTFKSSTVAVICQGETYEGYTTSGVYSTSYSTVFGCDSTSQLTLTVNPIYSTDTAIIICLGDSLLYDGRYYKQDTVLQQNFTASNGCDSSVKFTIQVKPFLLPIISGDSILCAGDSAILYCVGGSYDNYLWSTGAVGNSTTIFATGNYSVLVSNDNSVCIGAANFTANLYPLPEIWEQHSDRTLCAGDTVTIYPFGADSLYYTVNSIDNFTKVNSGKFNTIIRTNPQVVFLKGISNKGCVGYDTVTMYHAECCGTILMPNAFTPGNGDGINDVYRVVIDDSQPVKFTAFTFAIYNRWGGKVFESTTPQLGWNGLVNDVPADMGTYYYIIKLRCDTTEKEKVFKGDLLLLR